MKLTTLFAVLFSITVSAQISPVEEIKTTIETFFEGFHKGDTLLMRQTMANDLIMQTAFKNKEGKDVLKQDDASKFVTAIGNRPSEQKWEEKLLSFNIQVDGNMANVWTPYEFWLNGKFSHCGVNSFQLFKNNGTWKIIYLIDTRKRKGCDSFQE